MNLKKIKIKNSSKVFFEQQDVSKKISQKAHFVQ